MELIEGKLVLHYKHVDIPGGSGIDKFFEQWIQTALKAFNYELISTGMSEDNTRELHFDKMTRN